MLEQRVRLGELFDLYGGLLTEKQRKSYELLLQNDLSVAELGEALGMTRQGAHDLVRRTMDRLDALEESLRMCASKRRYRELSEALRENRASLPEAFMRQIEGLLASKEDALDV